MAASMSSTLDKTVTLDQMDYNYINKCENEKELERILRALRSGREGFYPQLIEHCEKKLESINPNNRGLRKQNRILDQRDLKQEEQFDLENSMNEWQEKMIEMSQVNGFGDHANTLPPVRGAHVLKGNQKKEVETKSSEGGKSNRIRSWDYKSWDKYDVDKECKDVDEKPNNAEKVTATTKKVAIPKEIDTTNLSEEEKHIKATKEKEKGNEAFKSGDFEEALSYYCRSISLLPIAASYNNRALVHLRLEKWTEAKQDCDTVLSMEGESQNLKAMLRRATACKELGKYSLAKADLLIVLDKEPNNARAKSILKDVEKLESQHQDDEDENVQIKSGKKMVIQEVEGDSDDEAEEDVKDNEDEVTVKSGDDSHVKEENSDKSEPKIETRIEPQAPVTPKFPSKTEELKSKAGEFFKTGRYGEAGEYYTQAIKSLSSVLNIENPEFKYRLASAVLHSNRAACWLKQGNDKACIDDCNTVLEIKTWDVKAFMRRATAYEHMEKYAKAWVDYKSAHSMDLSMTLAQDGANRVTTHLKEMYGTNWREKVPEVPLYSRHVTSSFVGGNVALTATTENNDESKPKIKTRIEPQAPVTPKFPSKTEELKSKAGEFFKTGCYGEAGEYYTQAIKSLSSVLNVKNPEFEYRLASALLHSNRAACWLKQGNDKACIDDCNTVLEIKTWDVKAFMRRATAYEHIEKYSKAWVDYKSAHSMDLSMRLAQDGANRVATHLKEMYGTHWREKVPEVPRYSRHVTSPFVGGNIASTTEKVKETEVAPTKLVTSGHDTNAKEPSVVEEKSKPVIEEKIGAISKSGEPKTATKVNAKSKHKKRNKSKSKSPKGTEQQKQDTETEEKRNKIRRDLYEKMKNDGNNLVKKGEYEAAIEYYTKCILVCPKEPASYTNRALCFLKLKKHISAINDCTEAIKIDPVNVKAYYRRSIARKEEKCYKDAERDIKNLLEIDPGNNAAIKELDVLKKLAWDTARKNGNDPPSQPRKKQVVIEEVDSSSSSDEGEFILPEKDEDSLDEKPTKSEKIVVLEEKDDITDSAPFTQEDKTEMDNSEAATNAPVEDQQEPPVVKSSPTKQQSMIGSALNASSEKNEPPQKSSNSEPITPFEFGAQWAAVSDKRNLIAYKVILDRVPLENLPSVLSNKIDDHVISVVAKVALGHIKLNGNVKRAFGMMKNLTKAKRFLMAAMFLSDKDQKALRNTFEALESHDDETYSRNDLEKLRNEYNL